jgi:hypothetical protein
LRARGGGIGQAAVTDKTLVDHARNPADLHTGPAATDGCGVQVQLPAAIPFGQGVGHVRRDDLGKPACGSHAANRVGQGV